MANATTKPHTIRPEEAAHFGRLAADWWDPKGSSAMLHRLNPVRLGFVRSGCGAGLLCEPLARLGAEVTGVDAAAENITAARAHAAGGGLAIRYEFADVASLGLRGFDLVTAMEVIALEMDPARNGVSAVAGTFRARSAKPSPTWTKLPSRTRRWSSKWRQRRQT